MKQELNINSIKPRTFLSIGLLITFFLPWFSLPFFGSYSGFGIPSALDNIIALGNAFDNEGVSWLKISYLLYLIPIVAIYNIFSDFRVIKSKKYLNEFIIGLCYSLVIYLYLLSVNKDATQALGIGFYLTALVSIIGIVFSYKPSQNNYQLEENFVQERVTKTITESLQTKEESIYNSHQEKIIKLQELKKLFDEGILTQQEFDEQKTIILNNK